MKHLRVLIVDDHPLVLDGLRTLLTTTAEIELVGEANNAEDAIHLATELQPDVVLLDIKLPLNTEGIEAARQITQISPQSKIVFLTGESENPLLLPAALRVGAYGYLLKEADREEVLRAIHAVNSGQMIFSGPTIAQQIQESISAPHFRPVPRVFSGLGDREHEILDLMAKNYRNKDIAKKLVLTERTVGNYVSHIIDKLQVLDRADAIKLAREAGLG
jgi:DNA-binding NarL/FixJ family response regulator